MKKIYWFTYAELAILCLRDLGISWIFPHATSRFVDLLAKLLAAILLITQVLGHCEPFRPPAATILSMFRSLFCFLFPGISCS